MEAMEAQNLFVGYRVGNSAPISVSHLQFADDTLLMGTKCWANVRALRGVLVLFETMSGLKVNFNKSMLVGVNIPDSWLGEAASALGCRVGKIPFLYLGLPIEGDPRRLSFWEPVLTRLKRQLSGWKSRFLSFGDRWLWQPDVDRGYTVRGAYQLLTAQDVGSLDAATGLIWHSQVPLKVSILAWRLLRDRLPTKVNLTSRGILPVGDSHCVSGCSAVESAQHVFLSCGMFGSIWSLVSSWVGSASVTAQTLSDHFIQFTSSAGGTRARRSFMQLI
ncbi:hypothetical protein TSUD_198070 [Trifolium subterraneum]|uniref:Reverse transcriptase zinc-binding domain-containing protein n=1 Tax=Trifolium subterraneum TaxID=3900 RepID=A0A2Z6LGE3_TRISU|nr:hypothetical protein TSUD_198070 [Trifolium subterraneum]